MEERGTFCFFVFGFLLAGWLAGWLLAGACCYCFIGGASSPYE